MESCAPTIAVRDLLLVNGAQMQVRLCDLNHINMEKSEDCWLFIHLHFKVYVHDPVERINALDVKGHQVVISLTFVVHMWKLVWPC